MKHKNKKAMIGIRINEKIWETSQKISRVLRMNYGDYVELALKERNERIKKEGGSADEFRVATL